MGIMTIDGQRVEFTDEPNVLSVIRKAELIFQHCAITQNYRFTEPAVCVRWKMREERHLPPVRKNQETEW